MAIALRKAGAERVLVANRTAERAAELAAEVGGEVVSLSELPDVLATADVLLTSTASPQVVVTCDDLAPVVEGRATAPLLVVDVAVPRDVDAAVADLPGATLLDIDDLRTFAQTGVDRRTGEVDAVERIVSEEVDRHAREVSARSVAPLVGALHSRAEDLRQAELDRYESRLAGLDDRQRAAVESLTRSLMAKVLHDPTVTLKTLSGTPTGDRLAESLRHLYGLTDLEG
jgi:glutamyl-tRNA reductase